MFLWYFRRFIFGIFANFQPVLIRHVWINEKYVPHVIANLQKLIRLNYN